MKPPLTLLGRLAAWVVGFLLRTTCRQLEEVSAKACQTYRCRLEGRISVHVLRALVVGEDHRFYDHAGVDPIAVFGALSRLARRGQLSGASTIEQQLVRVLTGRRQRTIRRKMQEMLLACYMDARYSKKEIVGMYLVVAHFGWAMNGVEEACRFLGFNVATATERQAASLIARLKYPEPREPNRAKHALIERRTRHILKLMSRFISAEAPEVSSDAALLDI